jgi:hypothetical protein
VNKGQDRDGLIDRRSTFASFLVSKEIEMSVDLVITHRVFDSETLSLMRATLDHAWGALPPDQQTVGARERIAQAILTLSMQWERDQDQPDGVSLAEQMRISLGVD